MKSYGEYSVLPQKIGSGAFGEIFLGTSKLNERVALKIEKSTSRNPQLSYEFKILQLLDNDGRAHERGLLKVYNYFKEGDENIMVMKVLGDSL
jgi:casein kinase 1